MGGGGLLFAQKHNPKYLREDDKAFKELTKRTTPNGFIEFKEEAKVAAADFFTKYAQNLGLGQHYELQLTKDETDALQIRHQRYQLYYKKTPVEGAEYTLHSKGGLLLLANGRIVDGMDFDLSKPMPEQKALDFALADKKMTKADFKEKVPEGKLVIALVGDDFSAQSFRLAYTFDLYGKRGTLDAHKLFVDALTGAILKREPLVLNCLGQHSISQPLSNDIESLDRLEDNDVPLSVVKPLVASTFTPRFQNRYGNPRDFESENSGNNFRLSMNNGALITRRDANNAWAGNPEQAFNGNNEVLNPTVTWGANQQNSTTAHWAIQRSYEYFRDIHGQNGPNNDGNIARMIVDIAGPRNEAFWSPATRIIGIGFAPLNQAGGVNQNNSFATLDICAHEYTHAITQFTAGLSVLGEPRSLNEGLSDIFGTSMERRILPNTWNWTIGEDAWTFRNMANPNNAFPPFTPSQPDQYQGANWNWTNPNERPHDNNGVLNKWFHSICTGQNPHANNIQAVAFDRAERIVYRAMRFYLQSSSGYYDMREATIMAARDLYGTCSFEEVQVTNAWAAGNVGSVFGNVCGNGSQIAPGCYSLRAKHSNKYLQVNGTNENSQLVQNAANNQTNQMFRIDQPSDFNAQSPRYRLISQSSFKFVTRSGSNNGAPVVQRFYNSNDIYSNKWAFGDMGDGFFIHEGGKSIDVEGGSPGNNVPIVLWESNFGNNQRFYLEPRTCPVGPTPTCSFTVAANTSDPNPPCGATVTLSASCSGSCDGVSYVWSGNGLNATGASVPALLANSGTFGYTVTASKPNCPNQQGTVNITSYSNSGGACTGYPNPVACGSGTGLRAQYYSNQDLAGSPVTTLAAQGPIDFSGSETNIMPGTNLQALNISTRWEGQIEAPVSGNYTFNIRTDDGVKMWFDNAQVVNDFGNYPPTDHLFTQQYLTAGQKYTVKIEWKQGGGGFETKLFWSYPNQGNQIIPVCRLYPAAGGGGGPACNFSTSATVNNANVGCGGSITLNAPCSGPDCSGISYTWSGNGFSQANQSVNINAPSANGSYTYYVQASKTGCTTQDNSVVVNVNGCGGGGSSTCSAENDQCSGNDTEVRNYSVSASSGGSYTIKAFYRSHEGPGVIRWSVNGGAVQTMNVAQTAVNNYPEITLGTANLNSGNNTFSLSSGGGFLCFRKVCIEGGGGGCTPPAAPTVSANPSSINAGQSSTLSASGCGGSVTWSNGQTGNSISVSPTQTSNYTATCSSNGCTSGNSNTATVTVGGGGGGCASGNFNGHLDYANCGAFGGWVIDFNDYGRTVQVEILVDGAVVATIPANQSRPDLVGAFGTPQAEFHGYTYNVPANAPWRNGTKSIVARPCGSSNPLSNSPRTVNFGACRVGVAENLEESSEIVVYPNPSNGELTLQMFLENRSDVRLDLHDLTGRRLWQSLLPKREGKVQEKLWLGEVSAGFYLLTVQTNERSWTQKVVLQK